MNLLDNAIKYTPEGGRVEIAAEVLPGEVCITVKDTGQGVPVEEVPRIWDRLYRGDKSRAQRGLGLGLSLVKAIRPPPTNTNSAKRIIGRRVNPNCRTPLSTGRLSVRLRGRERVAQKQRAFGGGKLAGL